MYLDLDRNGQKPMYRQIFDALRMKILNQELTGGAALPPSRRLAEELAVSRKPVIEAYEMLLAEGYIRTRQGSGSYVSPGLKLPRTTHPVSFTPRRVGFKPFDSRVVDFRSGLPDLNAFPVKEWQAAMNRELDRAGALDLAYQQPEGRAELRRAIVRYLSVHRGIVCRPEQVLICSGTTQGVGILSQFLIKRDRPAVVEDPVTSDIRKIIVSKGGRIVSIPVDGDGLIPERIPPGISPSFLYVTPSNQFPLGSVMPVQRRIELIRRAEDGGFFIVEDDYDSEFRYSGPPVSSFQGLAPERVVYLGTFSKTMFPALRIGYLILPETLTERARETKWITDLHNGSLSQLTLARFIESGAYEQHILRMKKLYRRKREVLTSAVEGTFGKSAQVLGGGTGIHLCVRFEGAAFTEDIIERANRAGVRIYPVSEHSADPKAYLDTLIFGFGMLSEERLAAGIETLGRVLNILKY